MSDKIHTTIADELKNGKNVTYFTIGVSMRPLLTERKTHVMIAPIETVKNGDILLYIRKNNAKVLHRCIKQDADFYYMRGDNTYGLERIQKEQAIGVVTHIYRKGKRFDVNNQTYKAYVSLWKILYPFRWFSYKILSAIRRLQCAGKK